MLLDPVFCIASAVFLLKEVSASFLSYAGYEPSTVVADQAAVARDLYFIEQYIGTIDGFVTAQSIYERGGNSKSYAQIFLDRPLGSPVSKGSVISGKASDGKTVTGTSLDNYNASSSVIGFLYPTTDDYMNHLMCRVGGLAGDDQVTNGCLAPNGTIQVNGTTNSFSYGNLTNKNARTLMLFSTNANTRFRPGDNLQKDFFPFFVPYVNYYGRSDFADGIVRAGFSGGKTPIPFDNGNLDLSGYGVDARAEVITKTTSYISAGLFVLRELYDAIYNCENKCNPGACDPDSLSHVDQAVAFYVGNMYASDPLKQGNMPYGLAEKLCGYFATCVNEVSGQSMVNHNIMKRFAQAKIDFANGLCSRLKGNTQEIQRLMQIPLIQGTLRYAYKISMTDTPTQIMQAQGAIFAAAILPRLHACSAEVADKIYSNMMLRKNQSTTDFSQVKHAFQSVYLCLKVQCADVGGIVDSVTGHSYVTGGAPCGLADNLAQTRMVYSSAGNFSLSAIVVVLMLSLTTIFL